MKTSFHFTNINLRYELEFENNNGHSLFCLHVHCIHVCYHMVGFFFVVFFKAAFIQYIYLPSNYCTNREIKINSSHYKWL